MFGGLVKSQGNNIPTTKAEITDFTRLASEMERRLGRVKMYCMEEERTFTVRELAGKLHGK